MLLVSALVAVNNLHPMQGLRGDAAAMNIAGVGRTLPYLLPRGTVFLAARNRPEDQQGCLLKRILN